MVLSELPREKSPVTPPGIDLGTVLLIAQRLNHFAIPGPIYIYIFIYLFIYLYIRLGVLWGQKEMLELNLAV